MAAAFIIGEFQCQIIPVYTGAVNKWSQLRTNFYIFITKKGIGRYPEPAKGVTLSVSDPHPLPV